MPSSERIDPAIHIVYEPAFVAAALTEGARWVVLEPGDAPLDEAALLLASQQALAAGAALIVAGGDAAAVAALPVAHRPLRAESLAEVLAVLRMGPPGVAALDRVKRPLWSLQAPTLT